jgi:intein/homing endonuclease|tara:strand:+ start:3640 stop:4449 length:810 start_codon:yes stop_codon:yes gene_type:complete
MKLNKQDTIFSRCDINKQIKLPNNLTPKLAEIIGIILGDGHIECGKKYSQTTMYLINIAGSVSEDKAYYTNHINPIFLDIFNTQFTISSRRNDELVLNLYSKAIATFFVNQGIKAGSKVDENFVPENILNSRENIKKGFLRGIFDTEGSMTFKKDYFGKHSKPLISLKMKSINFILQLKELLIEFDFDPKIYKEEYFDKRSNKVSIRYKIDLVGKKKLKRFLKLIGFRNPRHLIKVEIWKKHGFYPPRLSYQQRKDILDGKLNLEEFYN